jgi:hypothetical protein
MKLFLEQENENGSVSVPLIQAGSRQVHIAEAMVVSQESVP